MKGKVKAFQQHAGVEEIARRHIPLKVSFHQGCLALLYQSIRCKKGRQGVSIGLTLLLYLATDRKCTLPGKN